MSSSQRRSEPSKADIKIFLLSTISLSVAVGEITFNYGAFGTVFFDKVFTVWAAATAAFLASLFVPPLGDRRYLASWRGRFILLIPTVWVVVLLIAGEPVAGEPTDIALTVLSIIAALVTLPYTLFVLVVFISPESIDLKHPRLIGASLAIIAVIGAAAFVVGDNNELFLTCEEFVVSGNDTPARCKS